MLFLVLSIASFNFDIHTVRCQSDAESANSPSSIISTSPSTPPEYLVEETEDPNASNYVDYLSTVGDYDNEQPENSVTTDESAMEYADNVSCLLINNQLQLSFLCSLMKMTLP